MVAKPKVPKSSPYVTKKTAHGLIQKRASVGVKDPYNASYDLKLTPVKKAPQTSAPSVIVNKTAPKSIPKRKIPPSERRMPCLSSTSSSSSMADSADSSDDEVAQLPQDAREQQQMEIDDTLLRQLAGLTRYTEHLERHLLRVHKMWLEERQERLKIEKIALDIAKTAIDPEAEIVKSFLADSGEAAAPETETAVAAVCEEEVLAVPIQA